VLSRKLESYIFIQVLDDDEGDDDDDDDEKANEVP
jgi:hypothetical protein